MRARCRMSRRTHPTGRITHTHLPGASGQVQLWLEPPRARPHRDCVHACFAQDEQSGAAAERRAGCETSTVLQFISCQLACVIAEEAPYNAINRASARQRERMLRMRRNAGLTQTHAASDAKQARPVFRGRHRRACGITDAPRQTTPSSATAANTIAWMHASHVVRGLGLTRSRATLLAPGAERAQSCGLSAPRRRSPSMHAHQARLQV
jgi:hypothetical protein